eukprot:1889241-Prymnesium_polylepis.1
MCIRDRGSAWAEVPAAWLSDLPEQPAKRILPPPGSPLKQQPAAVPEVRLASLTADHAYAFRVGAVAILDDGSALYSDWSEESDATFVAKMRLPNKPSATPTSSKTAHVKWTMPEKQSYDVALAVPAEYDVKAERIDDGALAGAERSVKLTAEVGSLERGKAFKFCVRALIQRRAMEDDEE